MARSREKQYGTVTAQALVDHFLALGMKVVCQKGYQAFALTGMQVLTRRMTWDNRSLVVCPREAGPLLNARQPSAVFLVEGPLPAEGLNPESTYLCVEDGGSLADLINEVQAVFRLYAGLGQGLLEILAGSGSLEELCLLAARHFHNPVFIHDEYFNILASQSHSGEENRFEYNQATNTYTESVELINQFRIDKHYKNTLKTRGGHIYSSDVSEEDAMYANIWDGNIYRGRIVVTQHDSALQPSQLDDIQRFADVIQELMERQNVRGSKERQILEKLLLELMEGGSVEPERLQAVLAKLGWDTGDWYIAGCAAVSDEEITRLSLKTICHDMERKIQGMFTFSGEAHIYFLYNVTIAETGPEVLRAKMSYIIREGLMKVGVSSQFQQLSRCGKYFLQAQTALKYGRLYRPTDWYNDFQTFLLLYWLREGFGQFEREMLTAPALSILREYDKAHETQLYQTLKVYLDCERSSTLTSQILKIHRSTLPYRLGRIEELTGVNLDDRETRLHLSLSFYWEEYGIGGSAAADRQR